jgi:mRNA interferase MazF
VSEPRRGEVWLADIPGDKPRPVLILTRDAVLPRLTTFLIAPITTRIRGIATEVALGRAHGLSRPCVANFDNIRPISKDMLVQRVGRLGTAELRQACAASQFAVGC